MGMTLKTKNTYNRNTHISTNLGVVDKRDMSFWEEQYNKYLNELSIRDLSKYLGIDKKTVMRIFLRCGFKLLDKKEIYRRQHLKAIETWTSKYGVDNPLKCNRIKSSAQNTNFVRTGFRHSVSNPIIIERIIRKRHESTLNKWNSYLVDNGIELLDKFRGTCEKLNGKNTFIKYKFKHTCGEIFLDSFSDGHIFCPNCHKSSSKPERELRDYIKSKGITVYSNIRSIIPPYELDIYLPDLDIAFEYNGYCFHKEVSKISDTDLATNRVLSVKWDGYHDYKVKLCADRGISLYYLWENEKGDNMQELIEIINNIVGDINNV